MKKFTIAAVFACAATSLATTTRADDVIVDGFEVLSGEIDGNVIVVAGGQLILDEGTVHGDVIAEEGGGFWCLDTTIDGNVEARRATHMLLWWCTVEGDVDARRQQSDQNVGIRFSTIGGDVTIKQNDAAHIYLEQNLIAGNLQVVANDAADPEDFGIFVFNNEVGGNLMCVANDPTAVVFGNIVTGHSHVDD